MTVIGTETEGVVRQAGFTLPAVPESAGLARRWTEVILDSWLIPVNGYVATLLLTEVFSNAVRHGVGADRQGVAVGVELVIMSDGLRVKVHDPDEGEHHVVAVRCASATCESGRGLELVEQLSAGWGWEMTAEGKVVFFDLPYQADGEDPMGIEVEAASALLSWSSDLVSAISGGGERRGSGR